MYEDEDSDYNFDTLPLDMPAWLIEGDGLLICDM